MLRPGGDPDGGRAGAREGMTEHYVGSELELFSTAANWKSYFSGVIRPFVGGRVLEVGAGIGANIPHLYNDKVEEWTSLEPDADLAGRIGEAVERGTLPGCCRVAVGTLKDLDPASIYDTILYIDVLEHIAEDAAELAAAARHLAPGGHLVVLGPAHQFLFSAFDEAIGHYRRYTAQSLAALTPPGCTLHRCCMLDAAGFFASLANAALLRAAAPSPRQIRLWDGVLVPISRVLDRVTAHRFGKTVVVVWRR
jgi:SAM-dependent methyltransferase